MATSPSVTDVVQTRSWLFGLHDHSLTPYDMNLRWVANDICTLPYEYKLWWITNTKCSMLHVISNRLGY